MIAPFWNRNDLRKGGHVYYREVTSELILEVVSTEREPGSFSEGRVLERGQSEIRYQYDRSVHVKSAVIVTWEKMQPLEGTSPLPEEVSAQLIPVQYLFKACTRRWLKCDPMHLIHLLKTHESVVAIFFSRLAFP